MVENSENVDIGKDLKEIKGLLRRAARIAEVQWSSSVGLVAVIASTIFIDIEPNLGYALLLFFGGMAAMILPGLLRK